MCLLQTLVVSFFVYLTTQVNFYPQDLFKRKVVDCFLLKENILKRFLRGVWGTIFSSTIVGITFVWVLFNALASGEKLTLIYFITVAGLTLYLYPLVFKVFKEQIPPEVGDYLIFKYLPWVVISLTVIPYAVIFYFSVPVKDLVPIADPQRYLESVLNRYGYIHCELFRHLAVLGDFLNYLVWSVVLSLSKVSGQLFLFATFFLIIKGGISGWVVARTILGMVITLKNLKRV